MHSMTADERARHECDNLRFAVALKDHLLAIMDERDRRYAERDLAAKEAVRAALAAAEKASEKTEAALKEYKIGANEWRDTVKDLIAGLKEKRSEHEGESIGKHALWGYLVGGAGLAAAISTLLAWFLGR